MTTYNDRLADVISDAGAVAAQLKGGSGDWEQFRGENEIDVFDRGSIHKLVDTAAAGSRKAEALQSSDSGSRKAAMTAQAHADYLMSMRAVLRLRYTTRIASQGVAAARRIALAESDVSTDAKASQFEGT